jgi:type II secretory pathway component GspD/PulD (secretin)
MKVAMPTLLRYLIFFIILFWLGICFGASEKILQIYELKHIDAGKIVPVVKNILDKEETAEVFDNRLIIHASSTVQEKIKELLKKTDIPKPTLVVQVRQTNSSIANAVRLGTRDQQKPFRNSTHLGNSESSVTQQVLVRDGEDAFIVEGEEIPYSSELAMVSGRHQGFARKTGYKDVRTGFMVKPTLRGNMVDIEIIPFREDPQGMSGTNLDTPPSISYRKTATRLRIPINSWINLGGTVSDSGQEASKVVRWKTGKDYKSNDVWIKIDRHSSSTAQ